jgi:hypothetical protein
MGFRFWEIGRLKMDKEVVPSYGDVEGRVFPESIPLTLVGLCFLNSLIKLLIPLILEETYSSISGLSTGSSSYLLLISAVVVAIALSQLVMIAY